MITVRPEAVDDQADIQNVSAAAVATLRLTYRHSQKALDNRARISARLQRLVAVVDGHVVGTVQYYLENQSVRVIGLGVHSDFRRGGVARSLFYCLEESGKRENASRLQLHTVKETGNVEVFERLGFAVIAEREDEFFESDKFERLIDVEMIMQLSEHRHSE